VEELLKIEQEALSRVSAISEPRWRGMIDVLCPDDGDPDLQGDAPPARERLPSLLIETIQTVLGGTCADLMYLQVSGLHMVAAHSDFPAEGEEEDWAFRLRLLDESGVLLGRCGEILALQKAAMREIDLLQIDVLAQQASLFLRRKARVLQALQTGAILATELVAE